MKPIDLKQHFTFEEYLKLEQLSEVKHEFSLGKYLP